jgi:hypothetical protein
VLILCIKNNSLLLLGFSFANLHLGVAKDYEGIKQIISYSQANEILSSFDDSLRRYATKQLTKVRNVLTVAK